MANPLKPPAFWPLPDNEPIGPHRVDELFAYLAQRYPVATPKSSALPREQLADLSLDRTMTGVCVGQVSVRRPDDGVCVVGITLMRSGHLAIMYWDEQYRAVTVVV